MPTPDGISTPDFLTMLPTSFRRMAADGPLRYLSFGNIAVGIELLGACLDAEDFHKKGLSKRRFDVGISECMAQVDPRYGEFNAATSEYNLYKHLRCGMAHVLRPAGRVGLTSREEAREDGTSHLTVWAGKNLLVLVAEQFAADFEAACSALVSRLPTLSHFAAKLGRNHVTLYSPADEE